MSTGTLRGCGGGGGQFGFTVPPDWKPRCLGIRYVMQPGTRQVQQQQQPWTGLGGHADGISFSTAEPAIP